jgi:hypothetical protein
MVEEEILTELSHQLYKKFHINRDQTKNFLFDFFEEKSLFLPKKTNEKTDDLKKIAEQLEIEIPKNCPKFKIKLLIEKKQKENLDFDRIVKEKKYEKPELKLSLDLEKNNLILKSDISIVGSSFVSAKRNTWVFGNLIGTGGFGAVYQEKMNPELVIKTGRYNIDGSKSGIFFEKSVLLKLKDDSIGDLSGIPQLVDSGRLPENIKKDYFIILPKLEDSLSNIIENRNLDKNTINQLMIQILNSLSYINSKGYIHLDIKPENIMKKRNRWYLIDFGMASCFKDETKNDPTKANNGTLWFMSRDAHKGKMSRKCDLESLAFILAILNGETLDWQVKEKKSKENENLTFEKKNLFFKNLKKFSLIPSRHKNFIKNVDNFVPGTNPDYEKFQQFFNFVCPSESEH